jgi:hypothetical protein
MNELAVRRRFFADEIAAVAAVSTSGLIDAMAQVRQALFPRLRRLRRDSHQPGAACWLDAAAFCLSLD